MNILSLSRKLILSIILISGGIAITTQASVPLGGLSQAQTINSIKDTIQQIKSAVNQGIVSREQLTVLLQSRNYAGVEEWLNLTQKELNESLHAAQFQRHAARMLTIFQQVNELIQSQAYADDILDASAASEIEASAADSVLDRSAASSLAIEGKVATPRALTAAEITANDAAIAKILQDDEQRNKQVNEGPPHAGMHRGHGHPQRGGCMRAGMMPKGCHGFRHGHRGGHHHSAQPAGHAAAPHGHCHRRGGHRGSGNHRGRGHHHARPGCHMVKIAFGCKKK